MSKSKVLFIMTGSIACYKACHVVSRLTQNNCEVQVVASPSALQFVGNATLEGLSGKPVISDMYAPGNVMDHIHLMRWADLVVVAPATASFINKAAQGAGDDLIQTLFLAHDFQRPFLIAPAMNKSMYSHPLTQRSLSELKNLGLEILESASGILACGEEGWGRLLEPDLILDAIFKALNRKMENIKTPLSDASKVINKAVRVLVTAGGTQEPIDTVRSITNTSTGNTGIKIAETLEHMGLETVLLKSQSSRATTLTEVHQFKSFNDLNEQMKNLLSEQEFTHVIHAAAVSDFSVSSILLDDQEVTGTNKISSNASEMTLKLKRNPKIISHLQEYSQNKELSVIAFKLTSHASDGEIQQAVANLFKNPSVEYVIHNDLVNIQPARGQHTFSVFTRSSEKHYENLDQLISELIHIVTAKDEK